MPCSTCDHTMKRLTHLLNLFWCSRCGTVKDGMDDKPYKVEVPFWIKRQQRIIKDNGMMREMTPEDIAIEAENK